MARSVVAFAGRPWPALSHLQDFFPNSPIRLFLEGFSDIATVHTGFMDGWGETRTVDEQIDSWQSELVACEEEITRLRARQVVLIRQLDRFQVDCGEGARTMGDWTSARLDLSRQTANRLTQLAHADDPVIDSAMSEGRWGLDRAAALVKLRQTGLSHSEFCDVAENYSLGRLYGLLDRLRHLTPADEEDLFEYRYLVIQPSLDLKRWRMANFWRVWPAR